MSYFRFYFIASTALIFGINTECLGRADIPSPKARIEVLHTGEKLLSPLAHRYDLTKLSVANPFAPRHVLVQATTVKNARPASDAEFLQLLAAKLNPTGVLMMGDEARLLFGEKKVKVGEVISIPFDNQSIDVELVDLSRTSFTLKLNQEQLTRPIKPAKTQ